MTDLTALRQQLDSVDREFVRIAAERQRIVAEIGAIKRGMGKPLRDFEREKQVLDNVRASASGVGLEPELAANLMQQLIEASLQRQEQGGLRAHAHGAGRRALVIGGGGRMGGWFARFLDAQGYDVEIADPAGDRGTFDVRSDWRAGPLDHDLIIVAAPLRAAADILTEMATLKPPGVVLDIGSIKTPLAPALHALRDAGVHVCSMHPMFGPDTQVLAGRHVVFIDLGDAQALATAKALFAATTAIALDLDLDSHDRGAAFVLGLAHAVSIAFGCAMDESPTALPLLEAMAGTTFTKQLALARGVASENPHLYFEIQTLNSHRQTAIEAWIRAMAAVVQSVQLGDEPAFVALMERAARAVA